jgi:hypothetical protein
MLPVYLLASDRTHVESGPRAGQITIDGQHDDWTGALTPLGNDPISMQVVNDTDAVYVRLVASDAATRMQILRRGLIVWFDEGGGTKKRLGIHYPVNEGGPGGERRSRGGYGGGGRDRPDPNAPRDDSEPSSRVDILGPGKNDARSLTVDHASGVEVALRVVEGSLQYELKVPLTKNADHPYAIGAAPGATIGLGLETPKPERASDAGSGGRGGGYGGGGGGGRGGMGGGMRGRGMPRGGGGGQSSGFQPPKPLKAWTTVTLTRQPAQ